MQLAVIVWHRFGRCIPLQGSVMKYRQLKAFVKDYRDTLNNDLAKIDLIINAINENDRKQGDYIKNGIGLSDTAVIP